MTSSLSYELDRTSLWAAVTGPTHLLDSLENSLCEWSRQLARPKGKKSKGVRVYTRSRDEFHVLIGALIGLFDSRAEDWTIDGAGMLDVTPLDVVLARLVHAELLREYQAKAVRTALCAPLGRSILCLGTAAGKTHIAIALAGVLKKWNVLYLVKNQELAKQTEEKANKALEAYGSLLGYRPGKLICRSFQSLAPLEVADMNGVIVDECHALPARSHGGVIGWLGKTGKCRLWVGLSATPLGRQSCDNALVIGLLGPVLFEYGLADLARDGHVSPLRITPVEYDHELRKVKEPNSG